MRDLLVQLERERLGEDIERMPLGRQPKKAGRVWRNVEEEREKLRATLALIDRREPEALRTCVQRVALFWRLLNSGRGDRRRFLRPLDRVSPFPQWGWSGNEQAPTSPRRGSVWRPEGSKQFRVWNGKRWVTWTEKTRRLVGAEDRAIATCCGYAALSDLRRARVWLRLLYLAAETMRDELVPFVDKAALQYDDTAHHALAAFFARQGFKADLGGDVHLEHERLAGLAEQELLRLMKDRGQRKPPPAPPQRPTSEVTACSGKADVPLAGIDPCRPTVDDNVRDPASADERILLAVHRAEVAGKPLTTRSAIAAAARCSKREAQRAKDVVRREDGCYYVEARALKNLVRQRLLPRQALAAGDQKSPLGGDHMAPADR